MQRVVAATSVTVVLDLARAAATTVVGTLPTAEQAARGAFGLATAGEELTLGGRRLRALRHRPARSTPRRTRTCPRNGLVGKRVEYVYSRHREVRAHLPQREPVHVAVPGGEREGASPTPTAATTADRATSLYLFVWREKVVPTLGVVLVDWRPKVSNGKLFGYEGSDFGALSTTPISSRATLLNVTTLRLDVRGETRGAVDGGRVLTRPPSCVKPLASSGGVRYLAAFTFCTMATQLTGRSGKRCAQGRRVPGGGVSGRKEPGTSTSGTRTATWVLPAVRRRGRPRLAATGPRTPHRAVSSTAASYFPCHLRRGTETMQRKVVFAILALALVLGPSAPSSWRRADRTRLRPTVVMPTPRRRRYPRRPASHSRSASTRASPVSWPWTRSSPSTGS